MKIRRRATIPLRFSPQQRERYRHASVIGVVCTVVCVGVYMFAASRALTAAVAIEPETGTITSGATKRAAGDASGGNYVLFGVAGYQPTPSLASIFNPASFWYQPVDGANTLHPNSAGLVNYLVNDYKTHYGNISLELGPYSTPIYNAVASDPRYDFGFHDCQNKGYIPTDYINAMKGVPVPDGALAATGTDGSIVIYQASSDTLWEAWQAKQDSAGKWVACWGGRIDRVSQSDGRFTSSLGVTASGVSIYAEEIKISEMQAGVINHAIGMAIPGPKAWPAFSWPATRTDGDSTDPNAPAEGQRFRLDPSVNVETLNITPAAKIIMRAVQKYGVIITDKAGAVTLSAESSAPYVKAGLADPWSSILSGVPTYALFNNVPWDRLQALPYDYGKP